jgi:hypothetical protein
VAPFAEQVNGLTAGPDGWVRIAHLSPQAPAMDMYMYPFGNPVAPSC